MQVRRGGQEVALEPKAFDVLRFLVEHRDRLVTKDELLDGVWRDTFVTPNALTRAIAQLRKALGDDADQPRYIETVAKRGYRFVAPVTVGDSSVPTAEAMVAEPVHAPLPVRRRRRRSAAVVASMAVVVALAASGGGVWLVRNGRSNERGRTGALVPVRFSTRSGVSTQPSLSPD